MKCMLLSLLLCCCFFSFAPPPPVAGEWKILHPQNPPENRNECGMASVYGKIYLIGGEGDQPKPVMAYDPKTNRWIPLATAPTVMHHFQAVAVNNKIFVAEAFDKGSFPNQTPMEHIAVYDVTTNSWSLGAALPTKRRRAAAGVAVYNNKIYLVAGITFGHSNGTNNLFDEYDPATDNWNPLPEAPHIRDHCTAAVIQDKLYVVGGRNTSFHEPGNFMAFFSHTELSTDCYDFKTGKWSVLRAKLPLGSGGGALVSYHDHLIYMGGERATGTDSNAPRKTVYSLDPSNAKSEWVTMPDLQLARNGMAATLCNGHLYAAGGTRGPAVPAPPNPTPGKTTTHKFSQSPASPPGNKIVLEEMQ